ncbi:MAG: hypothetical protein BGO98_34910 [Myxococcales bacterium 68-20]|nr:hypothetical protein [Myxococcales bacterium]OJY22016.1 MAG: hypothetical protein BGO98_34910 [Myxococcales bacterium 68-20]
MSKVGASSEVATSSESAMRAVGGASVAAAGVAVMLSPIPLADELALLPVYAWLTARIAHARGRRVRDLPGGPLAKAALVGLGVRAALNAPLAGVPGVAAAMNAATAVGLTQIYAACVDHVCREPEAKHIGVRDILAALRARGRWARTARDSAATEGARPTSTSSEPPRPAV